MSESKIVVSEHRLYDIDPVTKVEFLAAPVGAEIEEAEYKRLLAYNKKRGVDAVTGETEGGEPSHRDQLKVEAAALGIEFKNNVPTAKLEELVAEAKAVAAAKAQTDAEAQGAGDTKPDGEISAPASE